jgi:hypothetical protein
MPKLSMMVVAQELGMKWDEYKSQLTHNVVEDAVFNAELIARYFNSKHVYTGGVEPDMVFVPMPHKCDHCEGHYAFIGISPERLDHPIGLYEMEDAAEALDHFSGVYEVLMMAAIEQQRRDQRREDNQ